MNLNKNDEVIKDNPYVNDCPRDTNKMEEIFERAMKILKFFYLLE